MELRRLLIYLLNEVANRLKDKNITLEITR